MDLDPVYIWGAVGLLQVQRDCPCYFQWSAPRLFADPYLRGVYHHQYSRNIETRCTNNIPLLQHRTNTLKHTAFYNNGCEGL